MEVSLQTLYEKVVKPHKLSRPIVFPPLNTVAQLKLKRAVIFLRNLYVELRGPIKYNGTI